ncbi:MAG TPA: NAD(P)/FAD-dependent oxidoreductase [Terriglobia bacterium]|nr:NAD(P)/FAD-dependent oxidoreductase [Terriglobia bacterium]
MKTFAVIGGGPAGSTAAEGLARAGTRVQLFEERPDWEKPCGGGVSARALRQYPFLKLASAGNRSVDEIEFLASNGARALVRMREPLAVYSRSKLNALLLRRAEEAGAEIVTDRVTRLESDSSGWILKCFRGTHRADFIVVAAGARTLLRANLAGPLESRDFMLTFGYYLWGEGDRLRVKFFDGLEGYAWIFPRFDHRSVGICGRMTETTMPQLQARLHGFMQEFGLQPGDSPVFAHLLPGLSPRSWTDLRLAGKGWALVGDAAGLVDPISGEGIYYAMRSGEILAECVAAGAPGEYAQRVWCEIGSELSEAARLGRFLFYSEIAGCSPAMRAVQYCRDNQTFVELTLDLMEGRQLYKTVVPRVIRVLGTSLVESTLNRFLKNPFSRERASSQAD